MFKIWEAYENHQTAIEGLFIFKWTFDFKIIKLYNEKMKRRKKKAPSGADTIILNKPPS